MQSRFLAIVSNGDLLRENMRVAADSEDIGTIQTLDSLESLETKLNQVQVAYQQFYTSIGFESGWKKGLDFLKNYIEGLNDLYKPLNFLPVGAASVIYDTVSLVKKILLKGLASGVTQFKQYLDNIKTETQDSAGKNGEQVVDSTVNKVINRIKGKGEEIQQAVREEISKINKAQNETSNTSSNTTINTDAAKQNIARSFQQRIAAYEQQAKEYQDRIRQIEQELGSNQTTALRDFVMQYQYIGKSRDTSDFKKENLPYLRNAFSSLIRGTKFDPLSDAFSVSEAGMKKLTQGLSANGNVNDLQKAIRYVRENLDNLDFSRVEALKGELGNLETKLGEINIQIEQTKAEAASSSGEEIGFIDKISNKLSLLGTKIKEAFSNFAKSSNFTNYLNDASMGLNILANVWDKTSRSGQIFSGALMEIAGSLRLLPNIIHLVNFEFSQISWMAVAMGVTTIINGINTIIETAEERQERLEKEAENANNDYLREKKSYKDLKEEIQKYKELEKVQNESAEARQNFLDASDALIEKAPELVESYTNEGHAIIDLTNQYYLLNTARKQAAEEAEKAAKSSVEVAKNRYNDLLYNRVQNQSELLQLNYERPYDDNGTTYRQQLSNINERFFKEGINLLSPEISDDLFNFLSIFFDFSEITLPQAIAAYNANQESFNRGLEEALNSGNQTLIDAATWSKNFLRYGQTVDREIKSAEYTLKAANRNAILTMSDYERQGRQLLSQEEGTNDIFEKFSFATEAINDYLVSSFENSDYKDNIDEYLEKRFHIDFDTIYDALLGLDENFGAATADRLNQIIAERSKYTQAQFIEKIEDYIDVNSDLGKWLLSYYEEALSFDDFKIKITDFGGGKFIKEIEETISDLLSPVELQSVLDVYTKLSDQLKEKIISESQRDEIFSKYISLWKIAGTDEAAQALINSWSDFSLSGVNTLIDTINDSKELSEESKNDFKTSLEELKQILPINLSLEVQTLISTATEGMEDFSKEVSNALKGWDFKGANEAAAKMGKTLQDLKYFQGKFYTDDFDSMISGYLSVGGNQVSELEERFKKLIEAFKFVNLKDIDEDSFKNNSNYKQAIEASGLQVDDVWNMIERYQASGSSSFSDYVMTTEFRGQINTIWKVIYDTIAREALSAGNIDAFITWAEKAIKQADPTANFDKEGIKDALSSGNIEALKNLLPDYISEIENGPKKIYDELYDKINNALSGEQYIDLGLYDEQLVDLWLEKHEELGDYVSKQYDSYGNAIRLVITQLDSGIIQSVNNKKPNTSERDILEKNRKIKDEAYNLSPAYAFKNILKSTDKIADDLIDALKTASNMTDQAILNAFGEANDEGEYAALSNESFNTLKEIAVATGALTAEDLREINETRTEYLLKVKDNVEKAVEGEFVEENYRQFFTNAGYTFDDAGKILTEGKKSDALIQLRDYLIENFELSGDSLKQLNDAIEETQRKESPVYFITEMLKGTALDKDFLNEAIKFLDLSKDDFEKYFGREKWDGTREGVTAEGLKWIEENYNLNEDTNAAIQEYKENLQNIALEQFDTVIALINGETVEHSKITDELVRILSMVPGWSFDSNGNVSSVGDITYLRAIASQIENQAKSIGGLSKEQEAAFEEKVNKAIWENSPENIVQQILDSIGDYIEGSLIDGLNGFRQHYPELADKIFTPLNDGSGRYRPITPSGINTLISELGDSLSDDIKAYANEKSEEYVKNLYNDLSSAILQITSGETFSTYNKDIVSFLSHIEGFSFTEGQNGEYFVESFGSAITAISALNDFFYKQYPDEINNYTSTIEETNTQARQIDEATTKPKIRAAFDALEVRGKELFGTEDQMQNLARALDIKDYNTIIEATEKDGIYKLKEGFETIIEDYQVIQRSIPEQLTNYATAMSQGIKFITEGATDAQTAQDYLDAYAEMQGLEKGTFSYKDAFHFDEESKTWKLSISSFEEYRAFLEDLLIAAGTANEQIANTFNQAAKEINPYSDIKNLLDNDTIKNRRKLLDSLETYYKVNKGLESGKASIKAANDVLTYTKGGLEAVALMQQHISDTEHRDLTEEETRSAYNFEIQKYSDAAEAFKNIGIGSYVTDSTLLNILDDFGYVVENGIVTKVGNAAEVYKEIIRLMEETGEATANDLQPIREALFAENNRIKNAREQLINSVSSAKEGESIQLDDDQAKVFSEAMASLGPEGRAEILGKLITYNPDDQSITLLTEEANGIIAELLMTILGVSKKTLLEQAISNKETEWNNSIQKAAQDVLDDIYNVSFAEAKTLGDRLGIDYAEIWEDLGNGTGKLKTGAMEKIQAAMEAKGIDMSADAIVEMFYDVSEQMAQKFRDAGEQLSGGVGDEVNKEAAEILLKAGYDISQLGTRYFISSVGDVEQACIEFYRTIADLDNFSAKELNDARQAIVDAHNSNRNKGSDFASAISGATMGEWINITDEIDRIGFNPLIADREFFEKNFLPEGYDGNVDLFRRLRLPDDERANSYNTVLSTGEYINGLPATFATILEDGTKLTDDEIAGYIQDIRDSGARTTEEIKAYDAEHLRLYEGIYEDFGVGLHKLQASWDDFVSLGEGFSNAEARNKYAAFHDFEDNLAAVGASIENGIIQTTEKTDPLGLIKVTELYYEQMIDAVSNSEMKSQNERYLAELRDSYSELISNYSDLISKGISGSLNNTQRLELEKIVDQRGWNINLDFKPTEEGLKLSQKSAEELYLNMKSLDYLQSRVLFNSLADNLKESNSYYTDIVAVEGRIAELQKEINSLPVSSARRQEYEKELEVAKEIKEVRAFTDEDSYNFMGRDLPTSYKSQLGFLDSIGSAFREMNDAADTGYMDVTNFYNMVTGFNDMAKKMGSSITFMGMELDGSLESTSKLLEKGFNSLVYADVDGSADGVKLSLEKWGDSFKDGAVGMQNGVQKGVREFAKSQIKMLDAMIAFLETVVAFEDFGELDTDGDGLDFYEVFEQLDDGTFMASGEAKNVASNILNLAKSNKDLMAGLKNVKVNGVSAYKMMQDIANQTHLTADVADNYYKTLGVMVKAAQDGDFSSTHLAGLIKDAFAGSEELVEVQIFDRTFAIKGDIVLEKDKNGNYIVDGKKYKDAETAIKLQKFKEENNLKDVALKHGVAEGKLIIDGKYTVKVKTDLDNPDNGSTYVVGDTEYEDKEEALQALYTQATGQSAVKNPEGFTEWILQSDAAAQLQIPLEDIELITDTNLGEWTKDQLEKNGINSEIAYGVMAGIQKAFEDPNFDFLHILLQSLLSKLLFSENLDFLKNDDELKKYLNDVDPYLVELGRELATGLLLALRSGINSPNNALNIGDILLDGLTDQLGVEKLEESINKAIKTGNYDYLNYANPKLVRIGKDLSFGLLMALAQGVRKSNDGNSLDIGQILLEGLLNWNQIQNKDDINEFLEKNPKIEKLGEILGHGIVQAIINSFTGLENKDFESAGNAAAQQFVDGFMMKNENGESTFGETYGQKISDAVLPAIKKALIDLFSKESLDDIIPLFETNADLVLAFDSIKIDSLINITNGLQQAINTVQGVLGNLKIAIEELPDRSNEVLNTAMAMQSLESKDVHVSLTITDNGGGGYSWRTNYPSNAKGNVALAKGTLMGELGPELYVTGGRYYVAGQNGAEMVDLPDDAIVFNHLQTKKLLGTGHTGRGEPVTNEKKATSYATGNVSGIALATAKQKLVELKALRAFWQGMLTASFKDLGGYAKSAKDKTDKDKEDKEKDIKNVRVTDDIQRWYNLTRQIDKLDKDIAYQESLISKYQSDRAVNGQLIHKSYKAQLSMLGQQLKLNRELYETQKDHYDNLRFEMENSAWSKLFSYTEDGLQQLHGMDILVKLNEEDIYGEGINRSENVQQQVRYLQELGFDLNDFAYDDSDVGGISAVYDWNTIYDEDGKLLEGQDLINAQKKIVENFFSRADELRDEYDEAYDSVIETENKILDLQTQYNEILQVYVDNQLDVEGQILDAIVDSRQAEIDELQKQRDAYEESVNNMVNGLNEALNKEQKIYQDQEDKDELTKLQRQLAILQRSGGAASQIRNLQNQILSKQQDMYFDERKSQIDAIQDASDKQLKKMDTQIQLMTNTLEYQKEHGLLWDEVYQVMALSEAEISDFIAKNGADWASKSTLQIQEDTRELREKVQQWVLQRDDEDLINKIIASSNNLTENIKTELGPMYQEFHDFAVSKGVDWKSAGEAEIIAILKQWAGTKNDKEINEKVDNILIGSTELTQRDSLFDKEKTYNGESWEGRFNDNIAVEHVQELGGGEFELEDKDGKKYYSKYSSTESSNESKATSSNNDLVGKSVKIPVNTPFYKYDSSLGGYVKAFDNKQKKTTGVIRAVEGNMAQIGSYLIPIKYLQFYKKGGLIDFTGPAWVDGSKSKPEAILSAEDTAILRNSLLGAKISLPEITTSLQTLQDLLTENNNLGTNGIENGNVYIENVEMNLNAQIKDDYSATRAGQQVFNEFIRIARKNGVNSVSRR